MFRALQTRNYRLWISGTLVSNVGTWMQRIAQDWLVLTVLTHRSGLAVGVTTGLQFLPMLLLAPFGGLLADRVAKRKLLMWTQSIMGASAALLGILVITGAVRLWEVFACALILGVATAIDGPSRQAFVSEIVPRASVTNAVSLNSASFNTARLIGPALAGLLITRVGTGPLFLINAFSFGAVLTSLARMRPEELFPPVVVPRSKGQIRQALRYVQQRPDLVIILFLVGVIGGIGLNFQVTNALMATNAFHKGADDYGLLSSVMAIGTLSGALLAARRERPWRWLVVGSALAFGIAACVAGLMPTNGTYAVALIFVGLSSMTFLNSCNTSIQLTTEPQMRGRVLSLYLAIQQGGTPIGAPIVGWAGSRFGARWSVLLGGLSAVAAASAAVVFLLVRHLRDRQGGSRTDSVEAAMAPYGPSRAGPS
jgi:MFS family permease